MANFAGPMYVLALTCIGVTCFGTYVINRHLEAIHNKLPSQIRIYDNDRPDGCLSKKEINAIPKDKLESILHDYQLFKQPKN